MRWKTVESIVPKLGDTKTKICFAFYPVKIGNAYVLFERYEKLYLWIEFVAKLPGSEKQTIFGQWHEVSRRIIKWKLDV